MGSYLVQPDRPQFHLKIQSTFPLLSDVLYYTSWAQGFDAYFTLHSLEVEGNFLIAVWPGPLRLAS